MLVTFTTDAYADITMFGDVALAMLKMMGHSGAVPIAILPASRRQRQRHPLTMRMKTNPR